MFSNSAFVTHSERPSNEKDTRESNFCWKFIPPRTYVLRIANEKGPFPVVLHMEVVVDAEKHKKMLSHK
jgi:hypothetical protein